MVKTQHVKTGEIRVFNPLQWKLLGAGNAEGVKNDWKPITDQTTEATQTTATPSTGQKTQLTAAVDKDKTKKLHDARIAELIAIDPRIEEQSNLGLMPEDKYNELKAGLTQQMADQKERADLAAKIAAEGNDAEITQEAKDAFLQVVTEKALSKSIIKDYFDKNSKSDLYTNKDNAATLANSLGEYLKWNVETLNANF